jgi:hypothetical protein
MKTLRILAIVFVLSASLSVAVFAQDPPPTTEPTPVIEPTGEPEPEFPEAPPELPAELPADPSDLVPLLEAMIMFGAGLLAKLATDAVKMVPWLDKRQGENVRRQVVRVVSVLAALAVAVVLPYASELAALLNQSGLWAVLLAVMSAQWGSHRLDKLLRGVSGRLFAGSIQAVLGSDTS